MKVKETGQSLGEKWADWFNTLSNTIRQSRDIDFWASQPGASIDNFNKSMGMFQNEYSYLALSMPAVEAAFRAYETTLRSIQSSNEGYIPPALIEYDARKGSSFWDLQSKNMVRKKIEMGTIASLKTDEETGFHVVDKDGVSLLIDEKKALSLDSISPEEFNMYMTLAKGVGLVSTRYLEIFANSRVPGSDKPGMAAEGFHSTSYEGIARSLNFFTMMITKWKYGSYKYFYLMNQLIPQESRIKIGNGEDASEAIRAYTLYQQNDGSFERTYGDDAKRFIDLMNPSNCSSALGVTTLWRQFDSTLDWSDRKREMLGGSTRLALSSKYADEALKDLFVINKYREAYRQQLIDNNTARPENAQPTSGAGFDKLWKAYGKKQYDVEINKEWDALLGKSPDKGQQHTKLYDETHHLQENFKKALQARIWVEMTMRNPLVVAHNIKVDVPGVGIEKKRKMKLHSLIVQEVLGIPLEDLAYGGLGGKARVDASPSEDQERYMREVLDLEGDLAAVREFAIREGRDLKKSDFDCIKDKKRHDDALKYWQRVREVMLGTTKTEEATKLYERFGLQLTDRGEGENYAWDLHKIHDDKEKKSGITYTLEDIKSKAEKVIFHDREGREVVVPFKLLEALDMKQDWIMGTDDMALGKMDLLNLGSRHWVRRGGDIASHEMGGQKVAAYLTNLVGKPDKHELVKALKEIKETYQGDAIEAGWTVVAELAWMTDRLYAFDYGRLGSSAQLDVWKTHRGIDAWMANGRREWWDAIEHGDVLPPHAHFYHYRTFDDSVSIHDLRKLAHADNSDVWREIITLGLLVALAMTIYRALTAPSEEEEGNSGGGGHH